MDCVMEHMREKGTVRGGWAGQGRVEEESEEERPITTSEKLKKKNRCLNMNRISQCWRFEWITECSNLWRVIECQTIDESMMAIIYRRNYFSFEKIRGLKSKCMYEKCQRIRCARSIRVDDASHYNQMLAFPEISRHEECVYRLCLLLLDASSGVWTCGQEWTFSFYIYSKLVEA